MRNDSVYAVSAATLVSDHITVCPSGVSVTTGVANEPTDGVIVLSSAGAGRAGVGRK